MLDRIPAVQLVEDERAEAVGEQRGVRRPEEGPVREAEVRQLRVADRLAQPVHVARDVGGGDVGEDVAVERRAAAQIALVLGQQARQVDGQRRRERLRVQALGLLVDLAVDRRRALADAARVEADDVEPLTEPWGEHVGRQLHHLGAGTSRAAAVEHHGADPAPSVGGAQPGRHAQRQSDRCATQRQGRS